MTLKQKINNKELTVGSWITLGSNGVAEILSNAGFDWLVIDMEHTTISLQQAGDLIRTIDLAGIPPLVRLTSNDVNQIKRVMDAGAEGIIVPMVNTEEEAINAVAATRYPPIGIRGVGLARAQKYGVNFKDYLSWQSNINSGPVVIVQIEHVDAVKNLNKILNVKGVDAFIIGPYDLSCSMGIPGDFDNPKFIEIMNHIRKISDKLDKVSGLHVVEPNKEDLNNAIDLGYRFIAYSVDIRMLDVIARDGLSHLKKDNK